MRRVIRGLEPGERQQRYESVMERWRKRNHDRKQAKRMGLPTYHHVRKLRRALDDQERLNAAAKLLHTLATNRFKSSFRKSIALQIRTWCLDPAPRYPTPLSARQWAAIMAQERRQVA